MLSATWKCHVPVFMQRAVRERETQLVKREKALATTGTEADERTAALAARQVAVQAAEAAASAKAEALSEAQHKLSSEREAHAQREQELSSAQSEVCILHSIMHQRCMQGTNSLCSLAHLLQLGEDPYTSLLPVVHVSRVFLWSQTSLQEEQESVYQISQPKTCLNSEFVLGLVWRNRKELDILQVAQLKALAQ